MPPLLFVPLQVQRNHALSLPFVPLQEQRNHPLPFPLVPLQELPLQEEQCMLIIRDDNIILVQTFVIDNTMIWVRSGVQLL
jgi:hypothetical protein